MKPMSNIQNTFTLKTQWWESLRELSVEDKAAILEKLFEYHLSETKEAKQETLPVKLVWGMVRPYLERNVVKNAKRLSNSISNGRMGGRPKKKPSGFKNNPVGLQKETSHQVSRASAVVKKTLIRDIKKEDRPKNTKENIAETAVFWFYDRLLPYHGENKRVFKDAVYEKWLKDTKLLFGTHNRTPKEFKSIVNWAIDNNEIAFIQSPGFFTKKSGQNYDYLIGRMESKTKPVNEIPVYKSKV